VTNMSVSRVSGITTPKNFADQRQAPESHQFGVVAIRQLSSLPITELGLSPRHLDSTARTVGKSTVEFARSLGGTATAADVIHHAVSLGATRDGATAAFLQDIRQSRSIDDGGIPGGPGRGHIANGSPVGTNSGHVDKKKLQALANLIGMSPRELTSALGDDASVADLIRHLVFPETGATDVPSTASTEPHSGGSDVIVTERSRAANSAAQLPTLGDVVAHYELFGPKQTKSADPAG
jgi:hypothetical protein